MPTFEQTRDRYSAFLQKMQVKPSWSAAYDRAAKFAIKNRSRYEQVTRTTGVPWEFIAALHWRESSGSFRTHLHNGDSLSARTHHVPAGRPRDGSPPFTWQESAEDALNMKGLHHIADWSLERMAYEGERYNGWGYFNRNRPSPYLFSGTNIYTRGKFVKDGVYSAATVDKQIGIMPLILRIEELEPKSVFRKRSRKGRLLDRIANGAKALISVIMGLFTADNFGFISDWTGLAGGLFDPKIIAILVAAGVGFWVLSRWIEKLSVEDLKDGRYTPFADAEQSVESENADGLSE